MGSSEPLVLNGLPPAGANASLGPERLEANEEPLMVAANLTAVWLGKGRWLPILGAAVITGERLEG